jgi:hypothetical protein
MDTVGGPLVVLAIAAVAFLLIGLAILHFGFHVFRRPKGRTRVKSVLTGDARVEVLETTAIDADRRLVLIRCDRIEHLIMIGGPADLVVENDVRKLRGPGAPVAKLPGLETEKRAAPTPSVEERRVATAPRSPQPAVVLPEPPLAPVPKAEPQRTAPQPAVDTKPAPAPRTLPASSRAAAPPQPPLEEPMRAAPQRPLAADLKSNRRELVPVRRPPLTTSPSPRPPLAAATSARPAEPLRAAPPPAANDRSARPSRVNGRTDPGPGLPAAPIPWSDPDSIENEIVRALRFDPQPRADAPARRDSPSSSTLTDSATTLGDLADRLEEALAREVQSASQSRSSAAAPADFSFESEPTAPAAVVEPPKPKAALPQKARPEKRERPEPQRAAAKPASETEAQPEPAAERREEAPVISLNSRRRESADPLEDEMARLLGELTGDGKGR